MPDLAGRLSSWSVELSEFSIKYEPHGPIKAQCLVDFTNDLQPQEPTYEWWIMHVDESSNTRGAGAGIVLEGPRGILIEQSLYFTFKTSNNQAEYEAIVAGLHLALEMEVKRLLCKADSKLTVGHLNGEYQVKDDLLSQYYHLAMNLIEKLEEFKIEHVPQSDNVKADLLSKLASTKKKGRYRSLLQQVLTIPSIQAHAECFEVTTQESWMSPFITYLETGKIPANQET